METIWKYFKVIQLHALILHPIILEFLSVCCQAVALVLNEAHIKMSRATIYGMSSSYLYTTIPYLIHTGNPGKLQRHDLFNIVYR